MNGVPGTDGAGPEGLRCRFRHASRCARHSQGSWPDQPAHTPVFLRDPSLSNLSTSTYAALRCEGVSR